MNPNENDLTRDEPLPAQVQPREEEIGSTGREQFRRATKQVSAEMSQTWDQTKEKASRAAGADERFPARKSRADHPRRAGPRNCHRVGDPLRRSERAQNRNRGQVTVGQLKLEQSFAAVLMAHVQISQEKVRKIGRCSCGCDERWGQAFEENGRGTLREADSETLERLGALSAAEFAKPIRACLTTVS
jgi:hypothetical protein